MRLIDDIGKGFVPNGSTATPEPWSPQMRNTEPRSVRQLLRRYGVTKPSEAATMQALTERGVYRDVFRSRKGKRSGLRTADGLPEAKWVEDK